MKKKPETFIADGKNLKIVGSPSYNYVFRKQDGVFARWGKTEDEDPEMCVLGPEIADIEISTVCNGIGKDISNRKPCSWCYKSNTGCGENMSLETFKKVFELLKPADTNSPLTQIAFGIGDIDGNPDLWNIMYHCRDNNIVPNITTNGMGMDEITAQKFANTCGAVSVSRYHIPDVAYNAIKMLTDAGLKQTNIHQLLAEETYEQCLQLLEDLQNDPRLEKVNAVVFLMLKPKGDRNKFHNIQDMNKFFQLIQKYQEAGIQVGMDSCTAPLMFKFAEAHDQMNLVDSIEPCESTLFSVYIDVNAAMYPCSFTENTPGWKEGINLLEVKNFVQEVWFHDKVKEWRNGLLSSSHKCDCIMKDKCRSCPAYPKITSCKNGESKL